MKKMRRLHLLTILACLVLLFSACTESTNGSIQLPSDTTDDTLSEAKETQDNSFQQKTTEASDEKNINNPEEAAFSWDDMTFEGKPFLPLRVTTREELDTVFGEPISVERIDALNHTIFWEKRQYDGILITCEDWVDADFSVGTVEYQRKDLSYVRGVHVGDSMEDVIRAFRNDATDFTPKDIDSEYGVVLYGTPQYMADFGILLYENDKPRQLMYQSQGGGVLLTLDDEGIVTSIEMFGGLH